MVEDLDYHLESWGFNSPHLQRFRDINITIDRVCVFAILTISGNPESSTVVRFPLSPARGFLAFRKASLRPKPQSS